MSEFTNWMKQSRMKLAGYFLAAAAAGGAWYKMEHPTHVPTEEEASLAKYAQVDRENCEIVKQRRGVGCEDTTKRELTANERNLAKGLFGHAVYVSGFTLHQSSTASPHAHDFEILRHRATGNYTAFTYGADKVSRDAATGTQEQRAALVGIMTRIWQTQNNIMPGKLSGVTYTLERGKSFKQYTADEQVSMVADYANVTFGGKAVDMTKLTGYKANLPQDATDTEKLAFTASLQAVVEHALPTAHNARRRLESSAAAEARGAARTERQQRQVHNPYRG